MINIAIHLKTGETILDTVDHSSFHEFGLDLRQMLEYLGTREGIIWYVPPRIIPWHNVAYIEEVS